VVYGWLLFAHRQLASMVSRTAVVPSLWKWEVANALLSAERRKRLVLPA
jgi:hypothetical protein